jgi:hypothetical protein
MKFHLSAIWNSYFPKLAINHSFMSKKFKIYLIVIVVVFLISWLDSSVIKYSFQSENIEHLTSSYTTVDLLTISIFNKGEFSLNPADNNLTWPISILNVWEETNYAISTLNMNERVFKGIFYEFDMAELIIFIFLPLGYFYTRKWLKT